ncbi:single-stranded DNA-binding protein [Brevibacterium renqingii]|uniref:single-stranded DNA-binding protein n=1 Tax=Brevibacterium renqingii TaxID=2776916 RepID=UPI001AE0A2F1|nr:single-stranded DNA-binding protein [Brevibacterium renqingii]
MSAIPITVTGTIATEPAGRTLPSGRACSSFRLAVNHWRVDRTTGEFIDDGTSWFSVDCYGDLASNTSTSLRLGTAVIVTGNLKIREWETEERSGIAPTVVAEHIGPDLRYGTAHYRKAKSPDRAPVPSNRATGETESSRDPAWGGLGETASFGDESMSSASRTHTSPAAETGHSGMGDPSGDRQGRDAGEGEAEAAEQSAEEVDNAIARDTADAAAPF